LSYQAVFSAAGGPAAVSSSAASELRLRRRLAVFLRVRRLFLCLIFFLSLVQFVFFVSCGLIFVGYLHCVPRQV
jgi:hypothetical protein